MTEMESSNMSSPPTGQPAGDLVVRTAEGDDLDAVLNIGHRTWPVIHEPIAGMDYVAMGLAKWWTSDVVAASIRQGRTLVAALDGQVVGMAAFGTQDDDFVLWKLYVLHEHHGRGIGSRLMDAVVERALDLGHARITVAYPEGNAYAERFHRAHGFRESHREPSGSGLPDTIWMVRELAPGDDAGPAASVEGTS